MDRHRRGRRWNRRNKPVRDKGLTLDISSLSEFPSLSAGPQTHTPNPSQAIWANATQRATQQNVIQRQVQTPTSSQQPTRASQPQAPSQQSQSQHQATSDDALPSAPTQQFTGQVDGFQAGSQEISAPLSGSSQPQPGSIEEFPPLGKGTPVDLSQERRETLLPGGFGSYGNGMICLCSIKDSALTLTTSAVGAQPIGSSRPGLIQIPNGLPGMPKEVSRKSCLCV